MSEFKLTTVEEFEAATNRLLETGAKVGADSWQMRVKNQTPHCKFGEKGICCRICSMGPCRITAKAPRGICGCDVHGIVGRNFLKFTAGGAATHSDHGREICHIQSRHSLWKGKSPAWDGNPFCGKNHRYCQRYTVAQRYDTLHCRLPVRGLRLLS